MERRDRNIQRKAPKLGIKKYIAIEHQQETDNQSRNIYGVAQVTVKP